MFEEKKPDVRVKSGICEVEIFDSHMNGGFAKRKLQMFGLIRGFTKRTCLISM